MGLFHGPYSDSDKATIRAMSRESLVSWLKRMDPNGIWSDDACTAELGAPMTREQALEQVESFIADDAAERAL